MQPSPRPAVDLEHGPRDRTVDVAFRCRKKLGDARGQCVQTCTGHRRAEEHGKHVGSLRLRGELPAKVGVRDRCHAIDVRRQKRVVVLGEHLSESLDERRIRSAERPHSRGAGAEAVHRAHRDGVGRQLLRDALDRPYVLRADAIDLVQEEQYGDAKPPQGPHDDPRLRLDTLDDGDHEYGAIEHVQHAFHLGDEVRMTGRVDEVDGDVIDHERHDGRLDRYPSLAFEREEVRLSAAAVDAADLVDDAGGIEQPLGECGLTGVYMSQDPQVQRSQHASCPLDRYLPSWTCALSSHAPWAIGCTASKTDADRNGNPPFAAHYRRTSREARPLGSGDTVVTPL